MSTLFLPLTFRTGLTIPNRVSLAAMTNKQSHDDGTLGDDELAWLISRAEGGFGLIFTCAAHVAKDGQGWAGELGIWNDAQLPGLRTIASAMRERHTAVMVQIFHGGSRADREVSGVQPWTATATDTARAATKEDLERVIAEFGDAAERAKAAGMDGVELHGAHGYLLTQFLSATENQRTDDWGGSLPNRARLVRSVMREVRARVGPSFTVGVRLSPEDFGNAKGLDLDESIQTAKWLADDGADFVHLSLWRSEQNTKKRPAEHAITLFRAALPAHVRIVVAGGIWTGAEAQALLARGADVVALGRSAIVNPDWPNRVKAEAADHPFQPRRPPLTIDQLVECGLSRRFAGYMGAWKNFVKDV
jgi:2,4-dienoyl-CoA reductase-like NADH-dependent reductase (Old Yellow Enzyme family)